MSIAASLESAKKLSRAEKLVSDSQTKRAVANLGAALSGPITAVDPRCPESVSKRLSPTLISQITIGRILRDLDVFECPTWAGLPNSHNYHFEVQKDGTLLGSIALNRFPYFLLGKDPKACDIEAANPSVSKTHCALVFHSEQKKFLLVDLGSSNGTFRNGEKLNPHEPVALNIGDEIKLGLSTRVYVLFQRTPRSVVVNAPPQTKGGAKGITPVPVLSSTAQAKLEKEIMRGAHDLKSTTITSSTAVAGLPSSVERTTNTPGATTAALPHHTEVPSSEGEHLVRTNKEEVAAATPPLLKRRFRHILIKHKDVKVPVSKGLHNKDEAITRSLEDALRVARSLRDAPTILNESGFMDLVKAFSECSTAKKGGDLGVCTLGNQTAEFDRAAFALGPAGVSQPFVTPLGVHIVFRCSE